MGWLTRAQLLESQGETPRRPRYSTKSVLNSTLGTLTEFARARIAEKLGDKARARDGYAFVAGMWQRGDPFFLQYVQRGTRGTQTTERREQRRRDPGDQAVAIAQLRRCILKIAKEIVERRKEHARACRERPENEHQRALGAAAASIVSVGGSR